MTLKLYVGDIGEYLSLEAKRDDPTAYLIDRNNHTDEHQGVCYTSLGDLDNIGNLVSLLRRSDTIVYAPPEVWSDTGLKHEIVKRNWYEEYGLHNINTWMTDNNSLQSWTEEYINIFSLARNKTVINRPEIYEATAQEEMLWVAGERKGEEPQLWFAGCSFTYGQYVDEDKRFSTLVSKELDIPMTNLAVPGSSMSYARDQLMRSDIRVGDTVIWGLTNQSRFPYFDRERKMIKHVNVGHYEVDPDFYKVIDPDWLLDFTHCYDSLTAIYQMRKYFKDRNIKLILLGILTYPNEAEYLRGMEEYHHLFGLQGNGNIHNFKDLASDGRHPGVEQNREWADIIKEILK